MKILSKLRASIAVFVVLVMSAVMFVDINDAQAEYGDVVINNYSDGAGMRPVVFPH